MPSDEQPHAAEARKTIQSIDRAVQLLHSFSVEEPLLGVTELSQRIGLHKSTVHRILAALEGGKLIRQHPDSGKYGLGLGIVELAGFVLADMPIREIAQPHLEELEEISRETVNLAAFSQGDLVNISQIQSVQSVKYLGQIGRFNPMHCSSGGKAALAFLPAAVTEQHLSGELPPYTPHTVTDPELLRKQLKIIRAQGYAVSRDEFDLGVTALSSPIFDATNTLIALVGISGPSFRMTEENILAYSGHVKRAAYAISTELGCHSVPTALVPTSANP